MLYRLFVLVLVLLLVFKLATATCLLVLVCDCLNRISGAEVQIFINCLNLKSVT